MRILKHGENKTVLFKISHSGKNQAELQARSGRWDLYLGYRGLVRGLVVKGALVKPADLSSIPRTYRLTGKYRKHRLIF